MTLAEEKRIAEKSERHVRAQVILTRAMTEIRELGLAPKFRWNRQSGEGAGEPHKMAANISDFQGFHELP